MELAITLRNIIEEYNDRLLKITEADASKKPDNKWSKKEYVGHLLDSASNNHQRFIRGQIYDNLKMPAYDQPRWVNLHNYQNIPWNELVNMWKVVNSLLVYVIDNVNRETLSNTMTIGDSNPVTLKFVIEDYIDHMKNHLDAIV